MSKQHKAKPLKLVDTQADYDFQRVADVAREVQVEAGPDKGVALANALEIARLQTEVADLREWCEDLEEGRNELRIELSEAKQWAKMWKVAAKIYRTMTLCTISIPQNRVKAFNILAAYFAKRLK